MGARSFVVLLVLFIAAPAMAGYTLFVRDRVTPQTITVNGPYGPEVRPNPGPVPVYPSTFTAKVCPAFNLYSSAPGLRTEVWKDSAGTATGPQVLAVCDVRGQVAAQVQAIRQTALNAAAKSVGVLAVYDENYAAATAYLAGNTTAITKSGLTVSDYLQGFGERLGMTAQQFAQYIVSQNRQVGPAAYDIEAEYLRLTYTVIPSATDIDALLAIPDAYRRFCGL